MVDRSLNGLAPNYLSSKFERREIAYNLSDSENKLNGRFYTRDALPFWMKLGKNL